MKALGQIEGEVEAFLRVAAQLEHLRQGPNPCGRMTKDIQQVSISNPDITAFFRSKPKKRNGVTASGAKHDTANEPAADKKNGLPVLVVSAL